MHQVLDRHRSRAAGQRGRGLRIRRRHRPRPRSRRAQRRHRQHQPGARAVPVARPRADSTQVPNPFFGLPAGQASRHEPHGAARRSCCGRSRSSATSSCASRRLGEEPVPRRGLQVREAPDQRLGRPHQLHLQPSRRTTSSARPTSSRSNTRASRRGAERLQPRCGVRIAACSTCRTSWCSRRSSSCRLARASAGPTSGIGKHHARRLDARRRSSRSRAASR